MTRPGLQQRTEWYFAAASALRARPLPRPLSLDMASGYLRALGTRADDDLTPALRRAALDALNAAAERAS